MAMQRNTHLVGGRTAIKGIEYKEDATQKLQAEVQQSCAMDVVKKLLEERADPNATFAYKLGHKQFEGTVLTLAVKKDLPHAVSLLAEYGADPESKYSMKAGRLAVQWKGPAVCGTVSKGNLNMMRLLVDLKAQLNGRVISFNAEPNGTLLYDASYFGHAHLVTYLLQKGKAGERGELEIRVKFQDNFDLSYTALHIASHRGHPEVVQVLLGAKASIGNASAKSECPEELRDAVDGCHVEVVRLLVMHGANLFDGDQGKRGVDYLFKANNAVLIAAAAQGLKRGDPKFIQNIGVPDFIRFLATPDAEEIVGAVFRPCEMRHWKGDKRIVFKSAYVPFGEMNTAVGPDSDHFEQQFMAKMSAFSTTNHNHVPDEDFLEQLLPNRFDTLTGMSQVPVTICQCKLPGIHRNPDVLWVMASGCNEKVFDEPGSRAIIHLAFREMTQAQIIFCCLDVLAACLFLVLAMIMNEEIPPTMAWLRWPSVTILSIIWCRNLIQEGFQFRGACAHLKVSEYLFSLDTLIDGTRLGLTGASLITLLTNWNEYISDHSFRVLFACAGFVRWLRVLNALKGFELTGKPMLPILKAIPATAPFLLVVMCWFVGFVHMYYSLGIVSLLRSSTMMYRLGFLIDFELPEMEDVPEDADADTSSPQWWYMNLIMVGMTASMSIILMNILIGVLGESYQQSWEQREHLFLLERSRIVLQHFTTREGMNRCRCTKRRDRVLMSESDADHVWYAIPKDLSQSMGGDVQRGNVHERVAEMKKDMHWLAENQQESLSDFASRHEGGSAMLEDRLGRLEERLESTMRNIMGQLEAQRSQTDQALAFDRPQVQLEAQRSQVDLASASNRPWVRLEAQQSQADLALASDKPQVQLEAQWSQVGQALASDGPQVQLEAQRSQIDPDLAVDSPQLHLEVQQSQVDTALPSDRLQVQLEVQQSQVDPALASDRPRVGLEAQRSQVDPASSSLVPQVQLEAQRSQVDPALASDRFQTMGLCDDRILE